MFVLISKLVDYHTVILRCWLAHIQGALKEKGIVYIVCYDLTSQKGTSITCSHNVLVHVNTTVKSSFWSGVYNIELRVFITESCSELIHYGTYFPECITLLTISCSSVAASFTQFCCKSSSYRLTTHISLLSPVVFTLTWTTYNIVMYFAFIW